MKKTIRLLSITFIFGAFLMSCEGPAGENGLDGMDGANGDPGNDGTAVCMACHNDGTAYAAKVDQFDESAHALGTYYDRPGDCSGCHSTDGYLARMDFTSADEIFDLALSNQSAMSCQTCHTVHVAYDETDWALTFADQVTDPILGLLSENVTSNEFDNINASNMCVQCHQSRDPDGVPSITSTEDVSISHYWGPHHGPQGNILNAAGGVNIVGAASYTGESHKHDCIKCHMPEGNHNLAVSNGSDCNECHGGDVDNYMGTIQAGVKSKLISLGRTLADLGVLDPDTESETVWNGTEHVTTVDTVGYHAMGAGYGGYGPNPVSADLGRCVFNYLIIAEDQSLGVHNPTYINALLDNTITLAESL